MEDIPVLRENRAAVRASLKTYASSKIKPTSSFPAHRLLSRSF